MGCAAGMDTNPHGEAFAMQLTRKRYNIYDPPRDAVTGQIIPPARDEPIFVMGADPLANVYLWQIKCVYLVFHREDLVRAGDLPVVRWHIDTMAGSMGGRIGKTDQPVWPTVFALINLGVPDVNGDARCRERQGDPGMDRREVCQQWLDQAQDQPSAQEDGDTGVDILVACEWSGTVTQAFLDLGHNAMSCDLLPTEGNVPHHQGDARSLLQRRWDLVIAHPPCRFLAQSGVQYMHKHPDRRENMELAAAFFLECLGANAPRVAVENPTPHRYAKEIIGAYDFAVQPWMFGEPFSKRTCFWTKGLPPLLATEMGDKSDLLSWHTKTSAIPGEKRRKLRSKFPPGMARAMARQWGSLK